PRWVYAGGKKLRGLERRRQAEKQICLSSLR
ncbi:MAG TPA: lysozyme, partial [Alcaligenes faecalis]|nr:lysozyme [Alcaligenes faecalis]